MSDNLTGHYMRLYLEAAQRDKERMNAEIARLRAEVETLRDTKTIHSDILQRADYALSIDGQVGEWNDIPKRIGALRAEVEDFKRQASDNATYAGQEASRADHAEAERDALRAEVQALEASVEGLRKECDDRDDTEQSLTEWLDEMTTERDTLRASEQRARELLAALKQGTCWCGVGIDNPMFRGYHSQTCIEVAAYLSPTGKGE